MGELKLSSELGSVTLSPENTVGSGVLTLPNVTDTVLVRGDVAVNVKHFGAVGDGVTDDTVALREWAASTTVGGVLELTFGIYLFDAVDGPLIFTDSGITIIGTGIIKAADPSVADIVNIAGDGVLWDGPSITGSGDVYSAMPSTETDRLALLRVDGDDVSIRRGDFTNPYMVGIRGNSCDNLNVGQEVTIHGGTAVQVLTYLQGVRLYSCTNFKVDVRTRATGSSKIEEGVQVSGGANGVVTVDCDASWDHGVYSIGCYGVKILNSNTVTDGSGIVCSPPEYLVDNSTFTSITNNTCKADGIGAIGMYLRDMYNACISGNEVTGFAVSYQMSPVQYDNILNKMTNVIFANNIAKEWTTNGFLVSGGGKALGALSNLNISNMNSVTAESGMGGTSSHISIVLGAGIVDGVTIEGCMGTGQCFYGMSFVEVTNCSINGNNITGCDSSGIHFNGCDDCVVSTNIFVNPGITGIDLLLSCTNITVTNNRIEDTTATMDYGIDGNNNCVGCRITGNTILGFSTTAPIRRAQFAGNTNNISRNTFGSDALFGVVTLTATTNTTIPNNNIYAGGGFTSRVSLTPISSAAAALVGGVNSPYVGDGDYTSGVEFKIRSAGSATGTEIFLYEII